MESLTPEIFLLITDNLSLGGLAKLSSLNRRFNIFLTDSTHIQRRVAAERIQGWWRKYRLHTVKFTGSCWQYPSFWGEPNTIELNIYSDFNVVKNYNHSRSPPNLPSYNEDQRLIELNKILDNGGKTCKIYVVEENVASMLLNYREFLKELRAARSKGKTLVKVRFFQDAVNAEIALKRDIMNLTHCDNALMYLYNEYMYVKVKKARKM